jgi:hypothetical protein
MTTPLRPKRLLRLPKLSQRLGFLLAASALVGAAPAWADETAADAAEPSAPQAQTAAGVRERDLERGAPFVDAAAAAGIDFVHFNGMSGGLYIPEIMGPGCALFDYDNDGDLDAYLAQGRMLGKDKTLADALMPATEKQLPLRGRLYRNDLTIEPDGGRRLLFTDVTEASGLDARGYGMGATVGDFDNDGWLDLFVTNYGDSNELWRNNGQGTFSNVTEKAGLTHQSWSTSATWVDFDGDGWEDLYVCNYLYYDENDPRACTTFLSGDAAMKQMLGMQNSRDYCGPWNLSPLPHLLYRNRGDGTFEDISAKSGVAERLGPGLGVIAADFDGDRLPEIYVANDMWGNLLWKYHPETGTFEDLGLPTGAAVAFTGEAESSMGVDLGDYDNDGDEDIILTHMSYQKNTLYNNNGEMNFEDISFTAGVAKASRGYTGFGVGWIDYDNNSYLDLFLGNGEIRMFPYESTPERPFPLDQKNLLLRNMSAKYFKDESRFAGKAFKVSEVSRGTALGDIDNDGDTDILVGNCGAPARLLVNMVGTDQPWIGFSLKRPDGVRDWAQARVEVRRKNGDTLWRRSRRDGSYLSSNDARVLVGLGPFPIVESVRVHWPDGAVEEWKGLPAKAYSTLVRGKGTIVEAKE